MNTKQFLISSVTVITLLVGYYYYHDASETTFLSKKTEQNSLTEQIDTDEAPSVENLVTTYKLPEGDQIYNISHGKEVIGPRAKQIIFSPLAIQPGVEQTITLIFPTDEMVSSAVIFVTTDNKENQKISLTKPKDTSGQWVGKWTPEDTINKKYKVRLYFVGPSGTYNNTMNFL